MSIFAELIDEQKIIKNSFVNQKLKAYNSYLGNIELVCKTITTEITNDYILINIVANLKKHTLQGLKITKLDNNKTIIDNSSTIAACSGNHNLKQYFTGEFSISSGFLKSKKYNIELSSTNIYNLDFTCKMQIKEKDGYLEILYNNDTHLLKKYKESINMVLNFSYFISSFEENLFTSTYCIEDKFKQKIKLNKYDKDEFITLITTLFHKDTKTTNLNIYPDYMVKNQGLTEFKNNNFSILESSLIENSILNRYDSASSFEYALSKFQNYNPDFIIKKILKVFDVD